jgi:exonuclease VII small subunit
VALLERLEMLITADGKAARREFEQIGKTADKELGKAEDRIGRTANRMQSLGTGVALGGAIVVGGLGLLAKAADDANVQVLKLENSIKNSDQAFRNNGKSLQDLAGDLQKVTAADADAVVGAQSVLVQFGLTESQILRLTPLVVDLSRKMGVDMEAAGRAVARSVDGSAGALKRMGISVDEAEFATDSFQATFDALNQTVGGFARQEGKTFSGQLEILKNNVGDLGEAVGTGAAGVLGSLAGQAAGAAGALNELNPGILTAVGGLATTAGLVATVGGGFAVAAGKALEFKDTLAPIGKDGERALTNVGKAAAGIAVVGAIAGIVTTVAEVANQVNDIDSKLATATDKFRGSLKGTDAELGAAFASLVEVEDKSAEFAGIWQGFGAEVQLGGFKADIEEVNKAFDETLDTFGPDAADRIVRDLERQNAALDESSGQYKTNAEFIDRARAKIDDRRKALVTATIAEKSARREQQAAIEAEEERQVTLESVTEAVETYAKKLEGLTAVYDANTRQAQSFGEALEKTTNIDGASTAAVDAGSRFTALKDSIGALPNELDLAGVALGRYGEKALTAISDLEQFGAAAGSFLEQMIQSGADDALVTEMATKFRDQLVAALQNAGVPPDQIAEYLGLAGLSEQQIKVALVLANQEEFLNELRTRLDLFQKEIDGAPLELRVRIRNLIDSGQLEEANKLIDTYTTFLSGNPVEIAATLANDPAALLRLAAAGVEVPLNVTPPFPFKDWASYGAYVNSSVENNVPFVMIDGELSVDQNPATRQLELFRASEAGKPVRLPVVVDEISPATFDKIRQRYQGGPGYGTVPVDEFGIPLYGRPGRATGGPVMANSAYNVNEVGAEMFVPNTPGFVMDHSESRALIEGVRRLLAAPQAGGDVINIYETAGPRQTAEELIRSKSANRFLAGVA